MTQHTLYVIVAQDDEGFIWVEDCIDGRVEAEVPEIWQEKKERAYRTHGAGAVRVAKLITSNGWMQALFKHPVVKAEPAEKIEDRCEVRGCAFCPFKLQVMSSFVCTHPGVDHLDPNKRVIILGDGSPSWCPLQTTPVIVRRTS